MLDVEMDIQSSFREGRNGLFVIKTGANGSLNGYNDKYRIMSEKVYAEYGYSTLIINNPLSIDIQENFQFTMQLVEKAYNALPVDSSSEKKVFYLGVSRGASMAAMYAWQYPILDRLLLLNPPLMINWHKLRKGLMEFKGKSISVVVGEKDPSYKMIGLVELLKKSNVEAITVPGADHNFVGCDQEFSDLLYKCLFA